MKGDENFCCICCAGLGKLPVLSFTSEEPVEKTCRMCNGTGQEQITGSEETEVPSTEDERGELMEELAHLLEEAGILTRAELIARPVSEWIIALKDRLTTLREYARHSEGCNAPCGHRCSCGFDREVEGKP